MKHDQLHTYGAADALYKAQQARTAATTETDAAKILRSSEMGRCDNCGANGNHPIGIVTPNRRVAWCSDRCLETSMGKALVGESAPTAKVSDSFGSRP